MANLKNGTLNYFLTKDLDALENRENALKEMNKMDPTYPDPNEERFKLPLPVYTIENSLLYRDGNLVGKIYNNKTGKVVEITEITDTGFKYQDTNEDAIITKDVSIGVVEKLTGLKGGEETRLIAKFNVTNTSSPTNILENLSLFSKIEIDGVVQENVSTTYQFGTTGEHIVKYTLVDPTVIGSGAFYNCADVVSMKIPNKINVNGGAFTGCTGLTTITINGGIISGGAFSNCTSLTTITINGGTISGGAFSGCTGLTTITINSGILNSGAFWENKALTNLTIGTGVITFESNVFYGCISLSSIIVDSNNTTYDSRNNCNAIIETSTNTLIVACKDTIIPNTVTSIGQTAFAACNELTNITIPNSVTTIGGSAFLGCKGLTSVGEIGSGASIEIPSSVINIGDYAFDSCTSLTSVYIPDTITNIGINPFKSCPSITSITVDSNNAIYDSRNGCNAIIETNSSTLITSCKNTIIPNTITSIGDYAFYDCDSLTSVTIPDSVTSIGDYAFYSCSSLTSVTMGNGVTSISDMAFGSCSRLTSITSFATTAPTIQKLTFYNVKTRGTLRVPQGSTGYDTWMQNANYYLGKYNWTKVEQ